MEIVVVIGGPCEKGVVARFLQRTRLETKQLLFIGVDGGALKLVEEGLPIRLAIGDFDSMTLEERHRVCELAVEVKTFPAEKDNTDFEEALLWIEAHYPEIPIHVLGAFGGRVDHALSCVWTVFRPDLSSVLPYLQLEDETNHISFLSPGKYRIKRQEQAQYLSFITMTPVKELTLEAVKYPLNRADYPVPMALISNEFLQDDMHVSFASGKLLVAQTRDAWR